MRWWPAFHSDAWPGSGPGAIWWFGGKHEATRSTRWSAGTTSPASICRGRCAIAESGSARWKRLSSILRTMLHNILIRISVDRNGSGHPRARPRKLGYQGVTGIAHILLEDRAPTRRRLPTLSRAGSARIAMQSSLIEELSDAGGATLRQARDSSRVGANQVLDDREPAALGCDSRQPRNDDEEYQRVTALQLGKCVKLLADGESPSADQHPGSRRAGGG
jgi:hypothetical protein